MGDFLESNGPIVELEDLNSRVFYVLVSYLYFRSHISVYNMSDLLSLTRSAKMMMLEDLELECVECISNLVALDTAVPVLVFSLENDYEGLKNHCLDILKNNLSSSEFASLMYQLDTGALW